MKFQFWLVKFPNPTSNAAEPAATARVVLAEVWVEVWVEVGVVVGVLMSVSSAKVGVSMGTEVGGVTSVEPSMIDMSSPSDVLVVMFKVTLELVTVVVVLVL